LSDAPLDTSLKFRPVGKAEHDDGQRLRSKTHLPRLLRAAERGETVIITRHGKPVAQLGPVQDRRRAQRPRVTVEEILAWRHEGHKY
jgi:prevent-host-death family protein